MMLPCSFFGAASKIPKPTECAEIANTGEIQLALKPYSSGVVLCEVPVSALLNDHRFSTVDVNSSTSSEEITDNCK